MPILDTLTPIVLLFAIFATTFLHGLYRYSVIKSYQYGDLSFVYPIARGGSVLVIGLISILILGVDINLTGIIGIVASDRNGKVAASFPVNEGDEVILSTDKGKVIRCAVKELSLIHI